MAEQPAPAYNAMGQLQPSVTSYSPTSSTTTKKPSREDRAALAALEQADAEQRTALQGLPPTPQAEGADLVAGGSPLEAAMASRAQSELATPKDPGGAPDRESPVFPREMAPTSPEYQDVIARAIGGNRPTDMAAPEAPKYTSQQLAAVPEMQPPKTFEQAQDEAAADKARYQAKLQAETQANLEAIDRERQQRLDASMRNINALSEQLARSGSIQPYHPSLAQKFSLALGGWVAAYNGGPNHAQELLQHQMDNDLEAQKERIRVAGEQLRTAGALPKDIAEYAKQRTEHALAMEKAKLDTFAAQTDKLLAPFPQFQAKAQQIIANTKATQAQKIFDNVKDITGSSTTSEGPHTVTVTGKEEAQGRMTPGSKDVEDFALDIQQGKDAQELEKLAKAGHLPTPEQYEDLQNRQNAFIARQAQESHSPAQVVWGRIMRGVDVYPTSVFPADMPEPERRAFTLQQQLGHVLTTKKFGVGILSNDVGREETFSKILPNRSDTPEAVMQKTLQLTELFKSTAEKAAEISKSGKQEQRLEARRAGTPESPATPTAQSKLTPAELGKLNANEKAKYFEARLEKPGSPDYADAQRAIQSLTARARSR